MCGPISDFIWVTSTDWVQFVHVEEPCDPRDRNPDFPLSLIYRTFFRSPKLCSKSGFYCTTVETVLEVQSKFHCSLLKNLDELHIEMYEVEWFQGYMNQNAYFNMLKHQDLLMSIKNHVWNPDLNSYITLWLLKANEILLWYSKQWGIMYQDAKIIFQFGIYEWEKCFRIISLTYFKVLIILRERLNDGLVF